MAQLPPPRSPREPIDVEVGTGQFERLLESRAPAVKEWPNWFRRNFTPAAVWTIGGVVLTSVVIVTTFIVTRENDKASNTAIAAKLDTLDGKISDQATKLQLVKCTTDKLAYAHAEEMWIVQADWNRRHKKPDPDRPKQPSTEGCSE